MTDRAVLLPERFRAGCAFGAGPVLAGPVSPTGQIEVGIVRPPHRLAKPQPESTYIHPRAGICASPATKHKERFLLFIRADWPPAYAKSIARFLTTSVTNERCVTYSSSVYSVNPEQDMNPSNMDWRGTRKFVMFLIVQAIYRVSQCSVPSREYRVITACVADSYCRHKFCI